MMMPLLLILWGEEPCFDGNSIVSISRGGGLLLLWKKNGEDTNPWYIIS